MNPYATLNLPKDATPDQIERAYKRVAKKTHPDMPGGSNKAFADATKSKQLLLDPQRRAHYDQTGNADEPAPDNAATLPIGLIMNVIVQAAAGFAQGMIAVDPTAVPLLEHVRQQLVTTLKEIKQKKAVADKMAATLKAIEKRLKRKPRKSKKQTEVSPMLQLAVAAQAASAERDASKLDPMIEAHTTALELLDNWEFEPDPQPKMPTAMRFTIFGT